MEFLLSFLVWLVVLRVLASAICDAFSEPRRLASSELVAERCELLLAELRWDLVPGGGGNGGGGGRKPYGCEALVRGMCSGGGGEMCGLGMLG
jgi:hypothetical protein